jgi:flagellar biosynthetic protein FliQ
MNSDFVINLMNEAIRLAAFIGLPVLLTALVVGVMISIFQAITQIQEMTLTFVPKIVSAAGVLYLLGPWMLDKLMHFANHVFTELLLVR